MGGKSKSRTSNSTEIDTDNSNTQVNDNDGLVVNIEDADSNETTIIQTDQGAIEQAFNFGGDALDNAFAFGAQSLNNSQDFGRDVLGEAQELSNTALQVAGSAQTNAFTKINDIANAFGNNHTQTLVLVALVIGSVFLLRRS